MLFSGLVEAKVAPWNTTGKPGIFRTLGELDLDKGVQFEPKLEATMIFGASPQLRRTPMAKLHQTNESVIKLPLLEGWLPDNLGLMLLGNSSTIAAGSHTGFVFPTGMVAGDMARLPVARPSSLVITDSAGSPATVDTDEYSVDEYGIVTMISVGTYVQPFKAAWSSAVIQNTTITTEAGQELWLMMTGINTANSDEKFLVEFYRCAFDPVKTWELIQKKGAQVAELEATVLADPTKAEDAVLGQFGRVQRLAAA